MRDVDLYRDRGLLGILWLSALLFYGNSNDLILAAYGRLPRKKRFIPIARRSWRSAEREGPAQSAFLRGHRENQVRVSVGIGNCWTQLNC